MDFLTGLKLAPRKRTAISEVVGTVLVTAITIVAGAAIFGYVSSQAGTASQAYGQAVGSNVNYLNEKFAVVDMTFGTNSVTVWIYNDGHETLNLQQVRLYDSASSQISLLYNYTVSGSTKSDYFYDLRSTQSSQCKASATSPTNYEPQGTVSTFSVSVGDTKVIQLSFPSSTNSNCPSYGQGFAVGENYAVTLVGANGHSQTFYEVYA